MEYETFGGFVSWRSEHAVNLHRDDEHHASYVRADCIHLEENGGCCTPEHGGCSRDCALYEPKRSITALGGGTH